MKMANSHTSVKILSSSSPPPPPPPPLPLLCIVMISLCVVNVVHLLNQTLHLSSDANQIALSWNG
jgi:hypothetical protein